jgi:hypothetical protein
MRKIEDIPAFRKEIDDLLEQLKGKATANKDQVNKMFDLHNQWFTSHKEKGKSCGTCRARVYQKLQNLQNHFLSLDRVAEEKKENRKALREKRKENRFFGMLKKEIEIVEFFERVDNYRQMNDEDRIFLYLTHNEKYPDFAEVSRNCTGCRGRMYKRLYKYYNKLKEMYEL